MKQALDQLYDLCTRHKDAVWLEIDGMFIRRRRVLDVVREMRRLPNVAGVRVEHRLLKFFYARGYLALRFYEKHLDERHSWIEKTRQQDELARTVRVDRQRDLPALVWEA